MSSQPNPNPIVEPTKFEIAKFFFTYGIAISVLIGYVLFIKHLLDDIGAEDESWKRMMLIFSSVEAIVFAAVGFLFGREVNKKVAEKAEKNEKEAKADTQDAKQDAKSSQQRADVAVGKAADAKNESLAERAKGLNLAATVKAYHGNAASVIGANVQGVRGNNDGVPAINPLLAKVQELYPEI